jgi:hypothetical protein
MATSVKALQEDNREIFWVAADAQKIADMQLGFHSDDCAEAVPKTKANVPLAAAIREQPNPRPWSTARITKPGLAAIDPLPLPLQHAADADRHDHLDRPNRSRPPTLVHG